MVKQLYTLIRFDELVETIEAGANNIGLVPMQNGGVPAHRVPLERVDEMFAYCREKGVTTVAIMLTNDPAEMIELTKRVKPDIVHVAGDQWAATPEFAKELKEAVPGVELMQAVLIDDYSALDRAKKYDAYCDYLLLDSGLAADTGIGASGMTHDWNIDAAIVRECNAKVIVAGGLGPDNVEEAIKMIKPFGVDSLTKTSIKLTADGDMRKDAEKVRLFCERADKAAKEAGLE